MFSPPTVARILDCLHHQHKGNAHNGMWVLTKYSTIPQHTHKLVNFMPPIGKSVRHSQIWYPSVDAVQESRDNVGLFFLT